MAMEQRVEKLENEVSTLKNEMSGLKFSVDRLTNSIDSLNITQQKTGNLEGIFTQFKSSFETHVKGEEKLERAIEKLSDNVFSFGERISVKLDPIYQQMKEDRQDLADFKTHAEIEHSQIKDEMKNDIDSSIKTRLSLIWGIMALGLTVTIGLSSVIYSEIKGDIEANANKINKFHLSTGK